MPIVNINVSVTNPPKPSNLLKSGALVSVGGTTLTAGATKLLTAETDLASVLIDAFVIETLTWSANKATVNLIANHGLNVGSEVDVVVSGNTPAGYNGTFTATVTDQNTLTYPLATDPGASTVVGTLTLNSASEIEQMNASFWNQGKNRSVYVLELGELETPAAVAALRAFIAEDIALGNTYQTIFSYLVPRAFDTEPTFKALTGSYVSPNSLVYFWVTTTLATYAAWDVLAHKSVITLVESPDSPDTSFDMAAPFQSAVSNDPGSSNQVPPMSYRFMYGTTVYPIKGHSATLKALESANVNYVGSAAEGGLSNMMLNKGHVMDGKPFNYWYSVAWAIINLELDLANEIINGSNDSVAPLYYDAPGVSRLQKRALKTMRSGVSYGLLTGEVFGPTLTQEEFARAYTNDEFTGLCVVNAVPYANYVKLNESAFLQGAYGGLSAIATPRRGFESITFNINVTNFAG